jgi:hypothetical protein
MLTTAGDAAVTISEKALLVSWMCLGGEGAKGTWLGEVVFVMKKYVIPPRRKPIRRRAGIQMSFFVIDLF